MEKIIGSTATVPVTTAAAAAATADADADELLFRKVAWRIVPFLFVCYVVSYLDRTNIGFAQLQMKHDLGFSDAIYGLGAATFFVGYVLFEVPSNLLLAKFGARRTFTRILLLWGLASVGMLFVSTPGNFYVLRFLLGVFEAGFFPGVVLYLTYWFPPNRRAGVLSVFFAGLTGAGVCGGLASGWIMRDMSGVLGLLGWQWLFVIEGLPAVLLAFVAPFCLVDKPRDANWLTTHEKQRLELLLAGSGEVSSGAHDSSGLLAVLRNPRVYLFAFVHFALTCATLNLVLWMPLMIRDFGIVDVVAISLYTVVPNAIGAVGMILIARHSDRARDRRKHFWFCVFGGAAALAALTLHLPSFPVMLALLSICTTLGFAAFPVFWAVPPTCLPGKTTAPGIAAISSIGMTSGIVGPWLIGQIRTTTGSMDLALYLLAALLFLSGIALHLGVRLKADQCD